MKVFFTLRLNLLFLKSFLSYEFIFAKSDKFILAKLVLTFKARIGELTKMIESQIFRETYTIVKNISQVSLQTGFLLYIM